LEKQYHQKKREWEDEMLSGEFDEGTMLRQRILQEVQAIKRETAKESYPDITKLVEEGLRIVAEEGEGMRMEIAELEMANHYIGTKIRQIQAKTMPKRRQNSLVVAQAQVKVNELRRIRESHMKDITDNFK
jgi:hypothetical protein